MASETEDELQIVERPVTITNGDPCDGPGCDRRGVHADVWAKRNGREIGYAALCAGCYIEGARTRYRDLFCRRTAVIRHLREGAQEPPDRPAIVDVA